MQHLPGGMPWVHAKSRGWQAVRGTGPADISPAAGTGGPDGWQVVCASKHTLAVWFALGHDPGGLATCSIASSTYQVQHKAAVAGKADGVLKFPGLLLLPRVPLQEGPVGKPRQCSAGVGMNENIQLEAGRASCLECGEGE